MDWLTWAIIAVFIIYLVFDKFILKKDKEDTKINEKVKLPYKVKDDFLTNTERSFYHSLKLYVGEKAVICPKVGLKEVFFIGKGVGKDYMKYLGKIAKKHVDFLLCDPGTMKPICGIELDDISHTNKKSYERDLFIDKEKEISVVVQDNNESVLCPKCSIPMVLRKATKGQNAGKEFYGCPNYPQCKEVINTNG